jgi:hypothetical protein
MMPEAAPITFQIVTAVSSGVAVSVVVVLWIMREFSKTRALFFRVISRHNREDDDNFARPFHLSAPRRGMRIESPSHLPKRRWPTQD